MAGRTLVFAAMAALLALGCQPSVEPLYPHPEIPRRADEVASITGPIAFIDERPVSSRGTVFQVLPGCHVVRLLDRIGEMNAEGTAGWSAHLPPLVFLFRTRGGFSYGIDVRGRSGITPSVNLGVEVGVACRVARFAELFFYTGATRGRLLPGLERSGIPAEAADALTLSSAIGVMFEY